MSKPTNVHPSDIRGLGRLAVDATESMNLRYQGRPFKIERATIEQTIPNPSSKLVVLLHGLCMNDLLWTRQGHNHGIALERELEYTPVYLRYNSGLHISTNGRAFSDL